MLNEKFTILPYVCSRYTNSPSMRLSFTMNHNRLYILMPLSIVIALSAGFILSKSSGDSIDETREKKKNHRSADPNRSRSTLNQRSTTRNRGKTSDLEDQNIAHIWDDRIRVTALLSKLDSLPTAELQQLLIDYSQEYFSGGTEIEKRFITEVLLARDPLATLDFLSSKAKRTLGHAISTLAEDSPDLAMSWISNTDEGRASDLIVHVIGAIAKSDLKKAMLWVEKLDNTERETGFTQRTKGVNAITQTLLSQVPLKDAWEWHRKHAPEASYRIIDGLRPEQYPEAATLIADINDADDQKYIARSHASQWALVDGSAALMWTKTLPPEISSEVSLCAMESVFRSDPSKLPQLIKTFDEHYGYSDLTADWMFEKFFRIAHIPPFYFPPEQAAQQFQHLKESSQSRYRDAIYIKLNKHIPQEAEAFRNAFDKLSVESNKLP